MKQYVLGFYFEGGHVLLIEKSKPDWQRGKVNGLGGSILEYETPTDAMVWEFQEESGIATTRSDWVGLGAFQSDGVQKNGQAWIVYVFRGRGEIPDLLPECDEGRLLVADVNNLPYNMEVTAHWLLLMCRDTSFSGTARFVMHKESQ